MASDIFPAYKSWVMASPVFLKDFKLEINYYIVNGFVSSIFIIIKLSDIVIAHIHGISPFYWQILSHIHLIIFNKK